MSRSAFASYLILLVLLVPGTTLADQTWKSGDRQVTLLELYSSEGCSSCPPAEAWLGKLQKRDDLWTDIVPVELHVDYWDRLGWKDPYARAAFTRRQQNYAAQWPKGVAYTPDFVVNGADWRGWFSDRTLPAPADNVPGPLRVTLDDGVLMARFAPKAKMDQPLMLHVAVLGFGVTQNIRAGENAGPKLTHDFVVLGYRAQVMSPESGGYRLVTQLPELRYAESQRKAIAAWVSRADRPGPLQAVGGWLQAGTAQ